MLYLIEFLCIFSFPAASVQDERCLSDGETEGCFVSLIELISNKELYDGKIVKVSGYYAVTRSWRAIFISSEHAKYGLAEFSIEIDSSKDIEVSEIMSEIKSSTSVVNSDQANGNYVTVVGKFKKYVVPAQNFHMHGQLQGTLAGVTKFEVLKP